MGNMSPRREESENGAEKYLKKKLWNFPDLILKIHIFIDPRNLANLKQEKYKDNHDIQENHVCAHHSKTAKNQR